MNKRTLSALKESIEHWKRLSSGTKKKNEFVGSDDCALCYEFIDDNCQDCPVRQASGKPYCQGTPYVAVCHVLSNEGHDYNSPLFHEFAKKELKFLISLLPKPRRTTPKPKKRKKP